MLSLKSSVQIKVDDMILSGERHDFIGTKIAHSQVHWGQEPQSFDQTHLTSHFLLFAAHHFSHPASFWKREKTGVFFAFLFSFLSRKILSHLRWRKSPPIDLTLSTLQQSMTEAAPSGSAGLTKYIAFTKSNRPRVACSNASYCAPNRVTCSYV